MRLGRAAFWRLLAINLLVTAGLVSLLPADIGLSRPAFNGLPLPPLPLKPVIAFLLCLPTGLLGARRLHDVGQPGWHAWLPLAAFACATFAPVAMLPLFLALLVRAQAVPLQTTQIAPTIMILLWLGLLLLAAGTLRTVFLWLQPGDVSDNRFGLASSDVRPPESEPQLPVRLLNGRMGRLPFWLLVAANVALAYAVMHGLRHELNHWAEKGRVFAPIEDWIDFLIPASVQALTSALSWISIFLYLPSFAAAALRLHDRNQSGILSLSVLALSIAATFAEHWINGAQANLANAAVDIATIYLLFQCLQPGDADANRYGPPPGQQPVPHTLPPAGELPAAARQAMIKATTTRQAARQGFGRRGP